MADPAKITKPWMRDQLKKRDNLGIGGAPGDAWRQLRDFGYPNDDDTRERFLSEVEAGDWDSAKSLDEMRKKWPPKTQTPDLKDLVKGLTTEGPKPPATSAAGKPLQIPTGPGNPTSSRKTREAAKEATGSATTNITNIHQTATDAKSEKPASGPETKYEPVTPPRPSTAQPEATGPSPVAETEPTPQTQTPPAPDVLSDVMAMLRESLGTATGKPAETPGTPGKARARGKRGKGGGKQKPPTTATPPASESTKANTGQPGPKGEPGGQSKLDAVQMVADVAGIADPTGIVDGVNAGVYLARAAMTEDPKERRGHLVDAGISALGVIPYVGDIAKLKRVPKAIKMAREAKAAGKGAKGAGKGARAASGAAGAKGSRGAAGAGAATPPPGTPKPGKSLLPGKSWGQRAIGAKDWAMDMLGRDSGGSKRDDGGQPAPRQPTTATPPAGATAIEAQDMGPSQPTGTPDGGGGGGGISGIVGKFLKKNNITGAPPVIGGGGATGGGPGRGPGTPPPGSPDSGGKPSSSLGAAMAKMLGGGTIGSIAGQTITNILGGQPGQGGTPGQPGAPGGAGAGGKGGGFLGRIFGMFGGGGAGKGGGPGIPGVPGSPGGSGTPGKPTTQTPGLGTLVRGTVKVAAVFAKLTLAAAGLMKALQLTGAAMIARQRALEELNATMAFSAAKLDIDRLQRDISRAQMTGGSFEELTKQTSNLEEMLLPFQALVTNVGNVLVAKLTQGVVFLGKVAGAVSMLDEIVSLLNQWLGGDSGEAPPYVKLLDDIAEGRIGGPRGGRRMP